MATDTELGFLIQQGDPADMLPEHSPAGVTRDDVGGVK